MSEIGLSIPEILENYMKNEGLKQRELASLLQTDPAVISKIRNRKSLISPKLLKKVSEVLKIDMTELEKIVVTDQIAALILQHPEHENLLAVAGKKATKLKSLYSVQGRIDF